MNKMGSNKVIKGAKNWFMEMLSTSDASSCMRFCVVVVVLTIMGNYTLGTIGVMAGWIQDAGINAQEIISLLGVLGLKLGQKKLESKS